MATALDLLMSTKEDTNLLSEESDICTIDAKTRIIFVPSTIVVGGVQSDKNAERIKFSCPKIVGDNLDLSKFSVRINFENVSSVDFNVSIKDQYICDDVAVDGENVTFSWLIGRNAARYMGTVRFIVCAVKTDSDSNISVEWNTTIAEVPVLEGIEIDQPQIGQEEKDVINQLLELTKNTSAEAVQNVNSAKEQAIKDIQSVSQPDTTLTIEGGLAEAKATGEAIGSLKEDLDIAEKRAIYYVNPNNLFPKPTIPELAAGSIVGKPYSSNGTLVENVTDYCNGVSLPSTGNLGFMFDVDDLVSGKYILSVKRSGATSYNGRCSIQFLNASLGGYETVSLDNLTVENPIWEYDLDVETKKESYSGLKYIRILFSNSSSDTAIYSEPVMVLSSAKYTTFLIDNLASYKRSKIYGKKLAVDGDSITYGQGYLGGYAKIIGEMYNMTVQNNAVGGATLATGTTTSEGKNRHWICDGISGLDDDADYVLVSGMFNDFWNNVPLGSLTVNKYNSVLDDTTVIGAVERICRELIGKYPTKKIGFLIAHSPNDWYRKDYTGAVSETANMTSYHDAIISALNKYSIPYCDLYMNSCFGTEITSLKKYTAKNDGIHPTEEGYKLFYVDKIVSFLETL